MSSSTAMPAGSGLMRHVQACNNVPAGPGGAPSGLAPLRLRGLGAPDMPLGWVAPALWPLLARHGLHPGDATEVPGAAPAFVLDDTAILERLGHALAEAGLYRFRDEAFDIVAAPGGPSLGQIDRGALPSFGLLAAGVHLNGLVHRPDGLHLWVGQRAANKLLDPGKLDNLVGGGVPAGHGLMQTLLKVSEEECSLRASLARQAVKVAEISYRMARPEGLRRDLLHCYDLALPPDWVPAPNDGEVEAFTLLPLSEVLALVRDTDRFKFNVNLVLIDLFLRQGLVDPGSGEGRALRAGLRGQL